VNTAEIANNAVTGVKIADGTIASGDLADNAVTSTKIAAGAVTLGKLAAGVVGPNELANLAVSNGKIADGAVNGAKITDGGVAASDLADNAVTTAKVANGAITRAKLGADVIAPPIAFGIVNATGGCGLRTPNVTACERVSGGEYEITIAGESYSTTAYVALVTVVGNVAMVGTDAVGGRLAVNIRTSSGSGGTSDRAFHFVVYKP
jgi:hypothetical protein